MNERFHFHGFSQLAEHASEFANDPGGINVDDRSKRQIQRYAAIKFDIGMTMTTGGADGAPSPQMTSGDLD